MDSPVPGKDVIKAYKEICRQQGAVVPVSPAYYQWFIGLNDEDMSDVLRLLILDRADEINSWVFAQPRTKTDRDIYEYLETLLHLLALGFLQFKSDGSLGCFAPLGPDPTEAEEGEIASCIHSSRPLIGPVILQLLKQKGTA